MRQKQKDRRLIAVMDALARCGGNGVPTSEIAEELGGIWHRNTVTRYLREFERRGLVTQGAIKSEFSHKHPGLRQGWFIES